MGRKRKGKSARNNVKVLQEPDEFVNAPHSFVIHKGISGGGVEQLTRDFRKVMEPFTASALRDGRKNTVKDFVHVASVFHVSHLSIFSRTENGMYMKIGKIPRGPTLTFKVHSFSLARDVVSSLRKQFLLESAFKHSPLIVLNNFSGEGMQFKLMASMFQNMFPTLNLQNVDLNTVKRVVMLNYVTDSKLIDFRHYAIKIMPVGVSKGVKKVVRGKVPDLSKCQDISEFLIKGGIPSESEAEDDPNAHVTLGQKITSRGNIEQGKSAIRLSELGPRLTLQLMKIEDGLMDGEVLFHDLVEKTEEEKEAIRKAREARKKLKEKRKKIQDDNTKRKEQAKKALKEKSLEGMKKKQGIADDQKDVEHDAEQGGNETRKRKHDGDDEQEDDDAECYRAEVGEDEQEDDDAEYYRAEVGEEPDKDLFTSKTTGFQRPKTFHAFRKKPRMDKRQNAKQDGGQAHGRFGNNKHGDKLKFKGGERGKQGNRGRNNKNSKEKTNASNRDFRPIGVKSGKTGVRKFAGKRR